MYLRRCDYLRYLAHEAVEAVRARLGLLFANLARRCIGASLADPICYRRGDVVVLMPSLFVRHDLTLTAARRLAEKLAAVTGRPPTVVVWPTTPEEHVSLLERISKPSRN